MTTELETVSGTFKIPFVTPWEDPYSRPFLTAPKVDGHVDYSFPLIDSRQAVFDTQTPVDKEESMTRPRQHLSQYGFTAVKHHSSMFDCQHGTTPFDDIETMDDIYYPEIQELVARVTGAKQVFVTNSAVRQSEKMCAKVDETATQTKMNGSAKQEQTVTGPAEPSADNKTLAASVKPDDRCMQQNVLDLPLHIKSTANVGPARLPHMDYTPLGAQRAIRFWRSDIKEAAEQRGIISTEDKIGTERGVKVTETESDAAIAELYNSNGNPSPRYAAYSIWRPLKKVTRDPLAMLPSKSLEEAPQDGVMYWPYEIRVPGSALLGGDFCRELAQLRIPRETDSASKACGKLPWYYLSDQTPEEVLIVKFFDSAALGGKSDEAAAPFHGCPDMGAKASGGPRESIEIRCIAFW